LWDEFHNDEKIVKRAEVYNMKYRQKYGSDGGAASLAGSGIGNDDNYSTRSQEKVIIRRRSQKAFSIFQPSLNDSQITPSTGMPKELADLRRFQTAHNKGRVSPAIQKVGFHDPGSNPTSSQGAKKSNKNSFFVCIDCDDADNESDYGNMIDPPARLAKQPKTKQDSFGSKVKKFFVYDSSASDSDLSDEQIQTIPASPKPKRKRGKSSSVLRNCLSADEPKSDEDNRGPSSVRSGNASSLGEHRQDSAQPHPRPALASGGGGRVFENNGVQPPAYSQAAAFPNMGGNGTVEARPRSYVPSVTGLRTSNA